MMNIDITHILEKKELYNKLRHVKIKDIKKLNIRFKKRTKEQEEIYKNPDNDSRGLFLKMNHRHIDSPGVESCFTVSQIIFPHALES